MLRGGNDDGGYPKMEFSTDRKGIQLLFIKKRRRWIDGRTAFAAADAGGECGVYYVEMLGNQ